MNNFRIESKEALFKILSYNEDDVLEAINNKDKSYIGYKLRKKNGTRDIYRLKNTHPIYHLQKRLHNELFKNILLPDCVYGFCKRKSYFDFLTPHVSNNKKRYFLRLDISAFFDSIRIEDISQSLSYYIDDNVPDTDREYILNVLVDIITLNKHSVQGAITSPTISNIVFRSLDIRIEKYCEKLGIHYTRYADDMLFSSASSYIHNYKFANAIQAIISDKGFSLNHSKTLKFKDEISLNGYVIGTDIRLSRKKYIDINRIIHTLNKSTFTGFGNRQAQYITRNKLAGYRSYLIQSLRFIEDESQKAKIENKINTIQKLIRKHCV